jgi:hypothetical protein
MRQSARIHQIFSELLQTNELWVSIDRVGFKPPNHPKYPKLEHKGVLHIDANTYVLPVPFGVQRALFLTDTSETRAGSTACRAGTNVPTNGWKSFNHRRARIQARTGSSSMSLQFPVKRVIS